MGAGPAWAAAPASLFKASDGYLYGLKLQLGSPVHLSLCQATDPACCSCFLVIFLLRCHPFKFSYCDVTSQCRPGPLRDSGLLLLKSPQPVLMDSSVSSSLGVSACSPLCHAASVEGVLKVSAINLNFATFMVKRH